MTTTHGPRSALTAPPPRPIWPTIVSVTALVVGLVGTVGLLFLAVALSLCGLGGDTTRCTEAYQGAWVALAAAGAIFLGVPAVVATVRRDVRWLLVPVVEGAVVGMAILANARF